MDCRQATSSLADLSAERLPESTARQLRDHLAECPPCEEEWQAFQQTVVILSSVAQPVPTPRQSQAMWQACAQSFIEEVERKRLEAEQPSFWHSPLGRWARSQPRWGWGALGGALAVFAGAWLLSPQSDVADVNGTSDTLAVSSVPESFQRVRFDRPPASTSPLINHHAAMAFDPFSDHVGSTLISYSATASSNTAPAVSPAAGATR